MQPKDQITYSERSVSSAYSSTPVKENSNPIDERFSSDPEQHVGLLDHTPLLWSRIRRRMMPYFSEFFGTFVFLLFSFGVTAQVVLSESKKGDYTTLCLGWGYVPFFSSFPHRSPVTSY
jgi:hypothetical protein